MNEELLSRLRLTPATEVTSRLLRLKAELAKGDVQAALILDPINRFYLTGTMQAGALLAPLGGPAVHFIVRDPQRAAFESPTPVRPLDSWRDLPAMAQDYLGTAPKRLGLELAELPANDLRRYEKFWPGLEAIDISPTVMGLRSVKSDYEAELMAKCGRFAARIYEAIPTMMAPGMTEIGLAAEITRAAMRGGHIATIRMAGFGAESFGWHVVSGASGSMVSTIDAAFAGVGLSPAFPMGASTKVIAPGEAVLVDFGLNLDGYLVDLTRMFSLGRPSDMVLAAHGALQEIERIMVERLLPGESCHDLYRLAFDIARDLGFGDHFQGTPAYKAKFAGHGVGLQLNEPPFLAPGHDYPLQKGNTVALELKMVFDDAAVGFENTFLITDGRPLPLTPAPADFVMNGMADNRG